MTQIQQMHETALHLRADAWQAELPGYAKKMLRAADELERSAVELEQKATAKQTGQTNSGTRNYDV